MKKEYELSKLKRRRGAVVKPDTKIQKTIRLDLDVLTWLMKQGQERGIPYQTLLNSILKERMLQGSPGGHDFREEVRRIVREELAKRGET